VIALKSRPGGVDDEPGESEKCEKRLYPPKIFTRCLAELSALQGNIEGRHDWNFHASELRAVASSAYDGEMLALRHLPILFLLISTSGGARVTKVTISQDGAGDFKSIQAAVDAAPADGVVIRIRPGIYRELVVINKNHIQLRGVGSDPSQVVVSYDLSSGTAGGTGKSASTKITGDDFYAENLTFENTFSRHKPLTREGSQAVALRVTGDRAVFRHVRFLGCQDTLYADGKGCDSEQGPCRPARQYFADCYIEGNVDFIFGDALAFFDRCEIHSLAHSTVFITAQSKRYEGERSGYIFDHCRLTAESGAEKVYLGRPWRSHSSVVFMNTYMGAQIVPAGWLEWMHNGEPSFPTVSYAESTTHLAQAQILKRAIRTPDN
jgi:pectinesterase